MGAWVKILTNPNKFALRSCAAQGGREQEGQSRLRALVVGPYLDSSGCHNTELGVRWRSAAARLAEACGLAQAIGLDIVTQKAVSLSEIRPGTYLGKGKVAELAELIKTADVGLVIMDCALSPVQQRNLERELGAKVIDRTGLILEIFGQRARTREGALQVEFAHLAYQKSRLVRSWTHLERQRGGFGFLGGPGETQIEADRRLICERMTRIERELESVKRTRGLHRKSRRAVPYPIVALVGYTNAGKSTLFNRLTDANVVAEDMLFATLDPTSRKVTLPHGAKIILSDTVGFISDLPTLLIKAFRATLEEVLEADIILHVRDIAHEESEAQRADVEAVLLSLGIDPASDSRLMEVWNKCDLLDGAGGPIGRSPARASRDKPVRVSALTGQGMEELCAAIEARLAGERGIFEVALDPTNGAGLNWLYENTEVMGKTAEESGILHLQVRVAPERLGPLRQRFPAATVKSAQA